MFHILFSPMATELKIIILKIYLLLFLKNEPFLLGLGDEKSDFLLMGVLIGVLNPSGSTGLLSRTSRLLASLLTGTRSDFEPLVS